jgi:hypothetical protein
MPNNFMERDKPMNKRATLEDRIRTALATPPGSATLTELIQEVETAKASASATAAAERSEMNDLVRCPDPDAARDRLVESEIQRDRLAAARKPLGDALVTSLAAEDRDRWWSDYRRSKSDSTRRFSLDQPSLTATTVLPPSDTSKITLWPKPVKSLAVKYAESLMIAPPHPGANWADRNDPVVRQQRRVTESQMQSLATFTTKPRKMRKKGSTRKPVSSSSKRTRPARLKPAIQESGRRAAREANGHALVRSLLPWDLPPGHRPHASS